MEKGCKWFVIYTTNKYLEHWHPFTKYRTLNAAKRCCQRICAEYPELEPKFEIRQEYVSA